MSMKNWFERVLECNDCKFSEDGTEITYCQKHADELHKHLLYTNQNSVTKVNKDG